MAEDSSNAFAENLVVGVVGALVSGAVLAALTMATPFLIGIIGVGITILTWMVLVVGTVALFFTYVRYVRILGSGAEPLGSRERQAYDNLRLLLSLGGRPVTVYVVRLTRFLDSVDRFFGDAGMANQTLFPRAFGLKASASLWTTSSFDRCLMLALVYPIASILLIWAASGHVGPAERALQLNSEMSIWSRLAIPLFLSLAILFSYQLRHHASKIRLIWLPFAILALIVLTIVGRGGVVTSLSIAAVVVAGNFRFTPAVITMGLVVLSPILGMGGPSGWALAAGVILICLGGIVAIRLISDRYGATQAALVTIFLLICIIAPAWLSSSPNWRNNGVLLLILGLLSLINAPFDWLSLGVTRALLRRGIELGGWYPYALALADAAIAVAAIIALAASMIIGVQAFDLAALLGHGTPTLLVDPLLTGIAANPEAPEYWWVYALLISTMIPSVVNLVIGGASLTRGIPGASRWLLRYMPAGRPVSAIDRSWIAAVLTLQWLIGAILGVGAQAVLVLLIFGRFLPWIEIDLLGIARWVAALDIPSYLYSSLV